MSISLNLVALESLLATLATRWVKIAPMGMFAIVFSSFLFGFIYQSLWVEEPHRMKAAVEQVSRLAPSALSRARKAMHWYFALSVATGFGAFGTLAFYSRP